MKIAFSSIFFLVNTTNWKSSYILKNQARSSKSFERNIRLDQSVDQFHKHLFETETFNNFSLWDWIICVLEENQMME